MTQFAQGQPDPNFFKVMDVGRRVAGTGSLGVDHYAILVQGKGSPDGNYLLDLKQALRSSLVPHLKVSQPKWISERHIGLWRCSAAFKLSPWPSSNPCL